MRKFLAGMMCLVLLLASAACSSNTEAKNPNLSDVIGEIRAAVEFPEMAEIKVADLPMYGYDLAPEDVAEMQFITAGSGFTADEVVLIKLNDESKAEEVKKMAETRRDGIAESGGGVTVGPRHQTCSCIACGDCGTSQSIYRTNVGLC